MIGLSVMAVIIIGAGSMVLAGLMVNSSQMTRCCENGMDTIMSSIPEVEIFYQCTDTPICFKKLFRKNKVCVNSMMRVQNDDITYSVGDIFVRDKDMTLINNGLVVNTKLKFVNLEQFKNTTKENDGEFCLFESKVDDSLLIKSSDNDTAWLIVWEQDYTPLICDMLMSQGTQGTRNIVLHNLDLAHAVAEKFLLPPAESVNYTV